MEPLGFAEHDHRDCIADGVAAAETRCKELGLQFTPVRRRVLEILLEQHRALGAYDILDVLRSEGRGAQPPAAYRALDFLVSHGFAHKIERLNAFVACAHPKRSHSPAFLICTACDSVAETHSGPAQDSLQNALSAGGFAVERVLIEAVGLCPKCQQQGSA